MLVLQTVNAVRVPTVLLGSIQSGALESLEERTCAAWRGVRDWGSPDATRKGPGIDKNTEVVFESSWGNTKGVGRLRCLSLTPPTPT